MNAIEYNKYFNDVAPLGSVIDSSLVEVMGETKIIDFSPVESVCAVVDVSGGLDIQSVIKLALINGGEFVVMVDRKTRDVYNRGRKCVLKKKLRSLQEEAHE